MKGKKKTPKVPGFMRHILADNAKKLMALHYRDSPNKPMALAKDAGLSLSTVQRILAGQTGATLDNIESLAAAFQASAYQMLIPALDAQSPQVVHGATKDEERIYRSWKKTGHDTTGPFPVLPSPEHAKSARTSHKSN